MIQGSAASRASSTSLPPASGCPTGRITNSWSSSSGTLTRPLGGAGSSGWSKVTARSHSARSSKANDSSGPASTSDTAILRPRAAKLASASGTSVALLLGKAASRTRPAALLARGGKLRLGGGELGRDRLGPGHERAPCLGEPHAATVADEQPDTGLLLQPADVVGDGGLGVAKRPGGRGQGAVMRDRPQDQKPPDVQHDAHART